MTEARCRSREGTVTDLRSVLKDVLLTFGDGDLGRLTRHVKDLLVTENLANPGNFSVTVNFLGSPPPLRKPSEFSGIHKIFTLL